MAGSHRRLHVAWVVFILAACFGVIGVLWTGRAEGRGNASQSFRAGQRPVHGQNAVDSGVFTPAHSSLEETLRDFFDYYPTPVQPIAFNHKIHIAKGMKCTMCHTDVSRGPDAGIPSAKFCMACHQVIATNNPQIQKLAAYAAKGQDVPWRRVNWFYPSAHVRFWHAPHIRAGVDCSVCHGNIAQETVAVRKKDLTMHFCLSCHREKGVSVDCTTCHD